jgi:hypothetical protein
MRGDDEIRRSGEAAKVDSREGDSGFCSAFQPRCPNEYILRLSSDLMGAGSRVMRMELQWVKLAAVF